MQPSFEHPSRSAPVTVQWLLAEANPDPLWWGRHAVGALDVFVTEGDQGRPELAALEGRDEVTLLDLLNAVLQLGLSVTATPETAGGALTAARNLLNDVDWLNSG